VSQSRPPEQHAGGRAQIVKAMGYLGLRPKFFPRMSRGFLFLEVRHNEKKGHYFPLIKSNFFFRLRKT
jgi:hypothetical protein